MKKVILFLTTVFLICFNLIYFKYFSMQKQDDILYKNNIAISIVYNNTINTNNFIKELKSESKKLNVNISQYVYLDENNLNIYSSNIENDTNIELIKGKYPKQNTDEYMSNLLVNNKRNIGEFKFPKSDLNIKCYNFDQIRNVGLGNEFIISGNNKTSILKSITILQKYGKTNIVQNTYQANDLNIRMIPSAFTILIISAFLLIISIIYYIVKQTYKISIQRLFGYSLLSVYTSIIKPILLIFFIGGFIINSIFVLYFNFNTSCDYLFTFYLQTDIFLWIISIILFLISILSISIIINNVNILSILKGKKSTNLNIIILVSKIIISITIFLLIGLLFNQYNDLKQELNNIKYWDKTKNIYKTAISNQGQEDNLALDREYNDKLCSLYKQLKINKRAFIINAVNYSIISQESNKITYLYNQNIDKGQYEYGPEGKSIEIDKGYLKVNPIKLSNNKILEYSLSNKNNVLNILVPEKFKSQEKSIYKSYLDYFYFAKVTVDNIYKKDLNLPLNNISKKDLYINILYVKNNQKYFTYSTITGSEKNHHYIIDPIVIIYDGKVDSSYMGSYASQNLYFFDESNGDAYKNISQYLKDSKTNTIVQVVSSVYKNVNQQINSLKVKTKNLLFVIIVLSLITFVFSITYIFLYYQNNSYMLYLKTLLGYSFINIHYLIIYEIIGIDICSSILASIYFKNIIILLIGLLFIILELFISTYFIYHLNRQNINKIIKGENK